MSRITKDLAKNVAKKLVEPKSIIIKNLKTELREFVTELALKNIPKKILELYKTSPDYIRTCSSVHVKGKGVYENYFSVNEIPSKNGGYQNIELNDEDSEYFQKTTQKIDKLQSEYKTLISELEALLFSFRTFKKATELFPECSEYLPKENAMFLPSINIDAIRNKLN